MLVPILKAPSESFAADSNDDKSSDALVDAAEKGGEGLWAGSSLGLVSGFQTSDNARVAWVGGVDMFSDEYINKEVEKGIKSGNRQFVRDLSAWTFREKLVLRIDHTTHRHLNGTEPKNHYTTNDNLVCQNFRPSCLVSNNIHRFIQYRFRHMILNLRSGSLILL